MVCVHNNLKGCDDFIGIVVTVDNQIYPKISQVDGMFTYKKYICVDCRKIITVLNAIVEDVEGYCKI